MSNDEPVQQWTTFADMHSGGGKKTQHEAYLMRGCEAECHPEFRRQVGRDPDNVTCECCGPDFSVTEHESKADALSYFKGWETDVKELPTLRDDYDAKVAECERLRELLAVAKYGIIALLDPHRDDDDDEGEAAEVRLWQLPCASFLPCVCGRGHLDERNALRAALAEQTARAERAETALAELAPLLDRMAKGRAKYPEGCTVLSLLTEAGEVAQAVNKRESRDRVRDELLDAATVAMRLYFGEIDTEWRSDFESGDAKGGGPVPCCGVVVELGKSRQ